MQSPFGSVSLVAEAYERELRADAARVRPARMAEVDGTPVRVRLGRITDAAGRRLIRAGQSSRRARTPGEMASPPLQ